MCFPQIYLITLLYVRYSWLLDGYHLCMSHSVCFLCECFYRSCAWFEWVELLGSVWFLTLLWFDCHSIDVMFLEELCLNICQVLLQQCGNGGEPRTQTHPLSASWSIMSNSGKKNLWTRAFLNDSTSCSVHWDHSCFETIFWWSIISAWPALNEVTKPSRLNVDSSWT